GTQHVTPNGAARVPERAARGGHYQESDAGRTPARFGILHHLSEFVHSKGNCACPGTIGGSLRPLCTACTCAWTAGNSRSFRSITHGAHCMTCVAGRTPSRMRRLMTVSLTLSSSAACSCVTQPSCFWNGSML